MICILNSINCNYLKQCRLRLKLRWLEFAQQMALSTLNTYTEVCANKSNFHLELFLSIANIVIFYYDQILCGYYLWLGPSWNQSNICRKDKSISTFIAQAWSVPRLGRGTFSANPANRTATAEDTFWPQFSRIFRSNGLKSHLEIDVSLGVYFLMQVSGPGGWLLRRPGTLTSFLPNLSFLLMRVILR